MTRVTSLVAVSVFLSLISISAHGDDKAGDATPAENTPQILISAGIDKQDQLILVSYRTIYIGFDGYSYNNRSQSMASLDDVTITTVSGETVPLEEARQRLADRDTPILASSWKRPLPEFYQELFQPDALHFAFPKKAPEWKAIQDPGRPVR